MGANDNMKAKWLLNGNLLDSSGNGFNLIGSASTKYTSKNGVANAAVDFALTDKTVKNNTITFNTALDIWVCMDVMPSLLQDNQTLFTIGTLFNGISLTTLNNVLNFGNQSGMVTNVHLPKNKFSHLMIKISKTTNSHSIYVDGVYKGSFTLSSNAFAAGFTLGYSNTSGYEYLFKGAISNVRVYNRTLTGEVTTVDTPATGELSEVYLEGRNAPVEHLDSGLAAHYRFKNRSLRDLSGNGRHLSKVGTVKFVADKDGAANNAVDFSGDSNCLETTYTNTPLSPCISVWTKATSMKRQYDTLVEIKGMSQYWVGFGIGLNNGKPAVFSQIGGLEIYLDKKLLSIRTLSGSIAYNTTVNKIQIGAATAVSNNDTDSIVDEVRVYENNISDGDVNTVGQTAGGAVAALFDMGVNYDNTKLSYGLILDVDFKGNIIDKIGNTVLTPYSLTYGKNFFGEDNSARLSGSVGTPGNCLVNKTQNEPFSYSVVFHKHTSSTTAILIGNGTDRK